MKRGLLATLLTVLLAAPAAAHDRARPLDPDAALEQSEAAIGNMVGDHVLTDQRGEPLPIAGLRGRPLVISLIYTSCSDVCPATTQHLKDRVRETRETLGEDAFAVLTVGFDARGDTPARLRAFAATQGVAEPDWHLATADAGTLHRLLDDVGFSYQEAAGGFQHITQTTILDGEGRVYRQVYGDSFPLPVFLEPLKELVFGTTASVASVKDVVDRIRFLCTVYNPATGAYEFEYAYFVGMAVGGFSLMVMGVIVFRMWRKNRRLIARKAAGQG